MALRYLIYGMLLALGACVFGGDQSRNNWDTISADAAANSSAVKAQDMTISNVGKGGKR